MVTRLSCPPIATGPLAVFVWKTVADPYVGKVSYFRVVSGTFHGDSRALEPAERATKSVSLRSSTRAARSNWLRPRWSRAISAA